MVYIIKTRLRRLHPANLLVISYLAAALSGAFLLSLSVSSTGESLSFINALFTATSSICVTGLIVVDTGTQFTVFGKSVIIILIQLGGLGVMTFSIFFFMFLRRATSAKSRWIITEGFTASPIGEIPSLLKSIFLFTFIAESIGAILLFLFWRGHMPNGEAMFTGIFHSISAFCNAGFSFFDTSFIGYRGSWMLNATILTLIVIGGIGFPVMYEFSARLRQRGRRRPPVTLHTRMVITTTLILIVTGMILIYALERNGAIAGLSNGEKIAAALFQSITARTAGFNTIDIPSLGYATLFILIILMFVGASPGSCGGGIKTTSLAVLAAIPFNKIRGNDSVSLFKRTLPREVVSRALSIFILAVCVVTTGLILLLVTQGGAGPGDGETFLAYLFEAVSAFGTVGLSMGVTATLSTAGKVIIIVLMLLGRVGLLTVAYVVTDVSGKRQFRYAEERVMIG